MHFYICLDTDGNHREEADKLPILFGVRHTKIRQILLKLSRKLISPLLLYGYSPLPEIFCAGREWGGRGDVLTITNQIHSGSRKAETIPGFTTALELIGLNSASKIPPI